MTFGVFLAILGASEVPAAVWGVLGTLGGIVGTLALGVGKQRNESAQVAISGLQALVVQQAQTIARLEKRVAVLEERLANAGLPIHGEQP